MQRQEVGILLLLQYRERSNIVTRAAPDLEAGHLVVLRQVLGEQRWRRMWLDQRVRDACPSR